MSYVHAYGIAWRDSCGDMHRQMGVYRPNEIMCVDPTVPELEWHSGASLARSALRVWL